VAGSTISHLENAVRDVYGTTLRKLAAALDVPVAQLFLGDDYPAPPPLAAPRGAPTESRRRTS
jgi:transcriptional regulator with XRE-family HTH domain